MKGLALGQGDAQQQILKGMTEIQEKKIQRQVQEIGATTLRMSASLQTQEALHRSQEGGCAALVQGLENRLGGMLQAEKEARTADRLRLMQGIGEIQGVGDRVAAQDRAAPQNNHHRSQRRASPDPSRAGGGPGGN